MEPIHVQRVLVEYSRITTDLEALEAAERADLEQLQQPSAALSATERQQLVRREQFALGRIEGLIQAQLSILERRQHFARSYRPGSASWPRLGHTAGRDETGAGLGAHATVAGAAGGAPSGDRDTGTDLTPGV